MLQILHNNALTGLEPLGNVTRIGGDLKISGNYLLTNLAGFESVTGIGGGLSIWYTGLTSLEGLGNLTSIGADLSIGGNDALISLAGLESLTDIGGSLSIGDRRTGNTALASLAALGNLTRIGGDLSIHGSGALTDSSARAFADRLVAGGFTGSVTSQSAMTPAAPGPAGCHRGIAAERRGFPADRQSSAGKPLT